MENLSSFNAILLFDKCDKMVVVYIGNPSILEQNKCTFALAHEPVHLRQY